MVEVDEIGTPQKQASKGGRGGTVPPAAHRFKKGRSGNPGGRPKGPSVFAAIQRRLREPHPDGGTYLDGAARAFVDELLKGSFPHAREVIAREAGAAPEAMRIEVVWRKPTGGDRD